jgi:hypothetical protein
MGNHHKNHLLFHNYYDYSYFLLHVSTVSNKTKKKKLFDGRRAKI